MEKNKYGVHKAHCCKNHGCKYGDLDCPVVSGEIEQELPCEECETNLEEESISNEHLKNNISTEELKKWQTKCLQVKKLNKKEMTIHVDDILLLINECLNNRKD